MAKRSAVDTLVDDVTTAVREEILSELQPILSKLSEATAELEAALGGARPGPGRKKAPGKRGPGRPRKVGRPRKAGRPPKSAGRPGAKRGGQRTPRGALQTSVGKALKSANKPMKLSEIRDEVLKDPMFKGRDPKTLYTMIVFAVKKMDNVKKTSSGAYSIKES